MARLTPHLLPLAALVLSVAGPARAEGPAPRAPSAASSSPPAANSSPSSPASPLPSGPQGTSAGSTSTPPDAPVAGPADGSPPAPNSPEAADNPATSDSPEAAPEASPPAPDPYLEAKQRVARGEKLFEEGNFDAALAEFERAYRTMEGHPARYLVLFNIGQCYEKLYRYDGAIEAYQGYLSQGGEDAEDARTVTAKMDLLATLLGRLELVVVSTEGTGVPNYELWVDGRFIGKNKTRALLPGGNHEVEIRASGFELQKQPLQLPATAERRLRFELAPLAKDYKGLRPAMFWTTSALALGTAIAGGVIGTMALDERSAINRKLDQGLPDSLQICGSAAPCGSPGADDPQKRIENLATTADIFFIGSGVLTVTAVVLGFMTDFSGPSQEDPKRPKAQVSFGPSGGRLLVEGAF